MRKLWCAGAIASGFLLLGAAPAHAGPSAGPVPEALDSALGYALEPTNGWRPGSPLASDPLSGKPLVQLEPGTGRPATPGDGRSPATENTTPARNGKTKADDQDLLPSADVLRTVPGAARGPRGALGSLPVQGVPAGSAPMAGGPAGVAAPLPGVQTPLPGGLASLTGGSAPLAGWQRMQVADLPMDGILGRALTRLGGLTPAGVPSHPGARTSVLDEGPVSVQRLERAEAEFPTQAEFPLLGGLGGGLPVNTLQRKITDVRSGLAGLPLGGTPVAAGRSAQALPDDGVDPAAAPDGSAAPGASLAPGDAALDGSTRPGSTPADSASAGPGSVGNGSAGTGTPGTGSAGTGSAGSVPAADGPATSASTDGPGTPTQPSAAAGSGIAAGEKPKPVGEQAIDDPRLHEEPIEGLPGRAGN